MKRSFKVYFSAALFLCGLLAWGGVPHARAQETKRVVVLKFSGPSAGVVRNHVVSAMQYESDVALVPSESFEGLSASARTDAAAEAQVSAFIDGSVKKKGKFLVATILVRDASSGSILHRENWRRKKNQLKEIRDNFWAVMGPYIMRSQVPTQAKPPAWETEPEEAPPAPVASAEDEDEEAPPPASGMPAFDTEEAEEEPAHASSDRNPLHPALILAIGPRLMWRKLAYDGDTTLLGYSGYSKDGGTPAFNFALHAEWYPGAHRRKNWLSNIGLELDADYALGLKAKVDRSGKQYKVKAYDVAAGLVVRVPLEMFEPRFRVSYVLQGFDAPLPADLPLPSVKYGAVRLGASTVVRIVDAFNFDVGVGYLIVMNTGQFGSSEYASKLSAKGWEIGAGATVRFKERFGLRLGVDFRRYKLDPGQPVSDDGTWIMPNSATDDYLKSTLSFVYTLPGVN